MTEIETALFSEFMQLLEEMEAKGEIDKTVALRKINELADLFEKSEHFWLRERKTPIDTTFVMYLASRNSKMIVEKMRQRFEGPDLSNPKVATDSARILPALMDIYANILTAERQAPDVRFILPTRMVRSIYSLRKIASEVNMLPSMEEELENVPLKTLKKEFCDLDARIWGMTTYGTY